MTPDANDTIRKAREMRHAIDMIEGALMGLDDFVDLPSVFEGSPDDLRIISKMTVGQMRRACTALAECSRIINSDEYVIRDEPCSPVSGWQPIDTAPKDGSWLIVSNGKYMDVARWSHGSFGGFSEDGDVLHWQPLPPLPSGQEQEGER